MAKPTITRYLLSSVDAKYIDYTAYTKEGMRPSKSGRTWIKVKRQNKKGSVTLWKDQFSNETVNTSELIKRINEWMRYCERRKIPYTISIDDGEYDKKIHIGNWKWDEYRTKAILKPRFKSKDFIWTGFRNRW